MPFTANPPRPPRHLIDVIDHWDRVGDWSQQWLNLRYVTRFLVRVGADDEALSLHRALVDAGKGSPLAANQLAGLGTRRGDGSTGAEAVALARTTLKRYCWPEAAHARTTADQRHFTIGEPLLNWAGAPCERSSQPEGVKK